MRVWESKRYQNSKEWVRKYVVDLNDKKMNEETIMG